MQVTPKITVLPGSGTRVIQGQQTNETKIKMDMEMQAQNENGQPAAAQPGQPNSITFTMTMDTFVAPSVSGYQEVGEFYRKMAKEINWMPPSNIHVDPRMSQGMSELAKNSDALKGLPMLSYVTMGIPPQPGSNPNGADGFEHFVERQFEVGGFGKLYPDEPLRRDGEGAWLAVQ